MIENKTIKQLASNFASEQFALVYVVNEQSYELLYVNQKLAECFPHNILGEKCYTVFHGKKSPCGFCPIKSQHGKTSCCKWEYFGKDSYYQIYGQSALADGQSCWMGGAVEVNELALLQRSSVNYLALMQLLSEMQLSITIDKENIFHVVLPMVIRQFSAKYIAFIHCINKDGLCEALFCDSPQNLPISKNLHPDTSKIWPDCITQEFVEQFSQADLSRTLIYPFEVCGNQYGVMLIHPGDDAQDDDLSMIADVLNVYVENKLIRERTEWERGHDKMTALLNRNQYELDLIELQDLCLPVGMATIDINNLKIINDTYGHIQGDLAIKTVAETLQTMIKDAKVYRMGGDEFLAILTNGTEEDMAKFCDRFITTLATAPLLPCNWRVVASCGYAYDSAKMPLELLYKKADQQMYKMKQEMKKLERQNTV